MRAWRRVVKSSLFCGTGGILLGTRTYGWNLDLECGHLEWRKIRYKPHPSGRRFQGPYQQREMPMDDYSNCHPPPKKIICEYCDARRRKNERQGSSD